MITASDFQEIQKGERYPEIEGPGERICKARFHRDGKKFGVFWHPAEDEDIPSTVRAIAKEVGVPIEFSEWPVPAQLAEMMKGPYKEYVYNMALVSPRADPRTMRPGDQFVLSTDGLGAI